MTLQNSFNKTNRKLFTFWQESKSDRSQIFVQKTEQNLYQNSINKSKPVTMALSKITDLSFDWTNFQILEFVEEEGTKKIFQTWQVEVRNLRYEQLSALRHNFVIRFGTGDPLFASQIAEDTTVKTVKNILSQSTDNTNLNQYTLYYGIYIEDVDNLEEIDENGMQVKLQLTLFNPNYYS